MGTSNELERLRMIANEKIERYNRIVKFMRKRSDALGRYIDNVLIPKRDSYPLGSKEDEFWQSKISNIDGIAEHQRNSRYFAYWDRVQGKDWNETRDYLADVRELRKNEMEKAQDDYYSLHWEECGWNAY
jgi:hypothetical protein